MYDISPPVLWSAPLKGYTDALFQRIHKKHYSGIQSYMAPFLLSSGDEKGWRGAFREYQKKSLGFMDSIPQILASDRISEILLYSQLFHKAGYPELNLNLGCGAACVMKRNKGASVLNQPDLLNRILETLCRHFPHFISLKLRLGIEDPEEIDRILPVINQYPLSRVIIHPRTAVQKYSGMPDINKADELSSRINHPVYYSGDIFSLKDYKQLSSVISFPGILLGRGLLGNPALSEEIAADKELSHNEKTIRFVSFYNELAASLVEELGNRAYYRLKGWWFYFSFHFGQERPCFLNYIYRLQDLSKLLLWEEITGEIHESKNR